MLWLNLFLLPTVKPKILQVTVAIRTEVQWMVHLLLFSPFVVCSLLMIFIQIQVRRVSDSISVMFIDPSLELTLVLIPPLIISIKEVATIQTSYHPMHSENKHRWIEINEFLYTSSELICYFLLCHPKCGLLTLQVVPLLTLKVHKDPTPVLWPRNS